MKRSYCGFESRPTMLLSVPFSLAKMSITISNENVWIMKCHARTKELNVMREIEER